jgi:hypothetical protein
MKKRIELRESDLQLAAKTDRALELNQEDYAELLEDIAADPASDTLFESEL